MRTLTVRNHLEGGWELVAVVGEGVEGVVVVVVAGEFWVGASMLSV